MTQDDSLLLIPEIMGWPEPTSIVASKHYVQLKAEINETLLRAGKLKFEVSGTEHGHSLFYHENRVPEFEEIIEHIDLMYRSFIEFKKRYSKRRICDCATCSQIHQLELGIIAHVGQIVPIAVGNMIRLHGPPVIFAEKLIHNELPEKSYALFTEKLFGYRKKKSPIDPFWSFDKSSIQYPDLGEIDFHYVSLVNRQYNNIIISENVPGNITSFPYLKEVEIDQRFDIVFDMLTDLSIRNVWYKMQENTRYVGKEVARVGDTFSCIMQNKEYSYEVVTGDFGEGNIVYGEKPINPPIVEEMTTYFIIEPLSENKVRLRYELHYIPRKGIGKLIIPFFKMGAGKQMERALKNFKQMCETTHKASFHI